MKQRARAEAETLVEREASLKESLEKLEEKSKAVVTLEQQVTELEHKLQQAEAKLLEKVGFFWEKKVHFFRMKPSNVNRKNTIRCKFMTCFSRLSASAFKQVAAH